MRLALLLAAVLPLTSVLTGCDAIADIAGAPDEVDVATGSAGQLAVRPEATTVTTADVNVGQDLPNLFDVDALSLPAGSVTFTPTVPTARGTTFREICPINLSIFIDGVRAADGQVTVDVQGTTGTVTQASVQYANGYSASTICDTFPGGECPATAGTYTRQQIQDHVTEAIQSGRFGLDIAAQNTGSCQGALAIQELRFGLDY